MSAKKDTVNLPVLKALLLNIFKDLNKLSALYNTDTCTKEIMQETFAKREAYVRKFATDEKMYKYLMDWYIYFFKCIGRLTKENVNKSELANLYRNLHAIAEKYLVAKQLTCDDFECLGHATSYCYKISERYKEGTFPQRWIENMTDYLFTTISNYEKEKTA